MQTDILNLEKAFLGWLNQLEYIEDKVISIVQLIDGIILSKLLRSM
jgi:hypothetical protein